MKDQHSLEIVKQAILLEKRGKNFYQSVADHAADAKVKAFFEFMAQEETDHIRILGIQYKAYQETGRFAPDSFDSDAVSQIPDKVLDKQTRDIISAASVEAASIGAAILMEKRAVDIYSQRAAEATDPEEKKLFAWLAAWEKEHLDMLMDIDRDLMESVWNDNSFWPM